VGSRCAAPATATDTPGERIRDGDRESIPLPRRPTGTATGTTRSLDRPRVSSARVLGVRHATSSSRPELSERLGECRRDVPFGRNGSGSSGACLSTRATPHERPRARTALHESLVLALARRLEPPRSVQRDHRHDVLDHRQPVTGQQHTRTGRLAVVPANRTDLPAVADPARQQRHGACPRAGAGGDG
jgi:hypothetical protein